MARWYGQYWLPKTSLYDMASLTIDAYRLITDLKTRGFAEDQARGVTEAVRAIDLDNVSTKADVLAFKADLDVKIADLKSDLFKWLIPLLMGQAALIVTPMKLL